MSDPFLSEIRAMSFGYAPVGWALCNGQTLPIAQNQALFSLIGTTYGGDGVTNFKLPNLQGSAPLHFGADESKNAYQLGQSGGEPAHTLTLNETPSHSHSLNAANVAADAAPAGVTPGPTLVPAQAAAFEGTNPVQATSIYSTGAANVTMAASAVAMAGGGQAHENRQPLLTLNYCIALQGVFPSQT